MNKKEPINIMSLVFSIVTLIIGIVLCINGHDGIFKLIGYFISGLLILFGLVRFIISVVGYKKNNMMIYSDLFSGIVLVAIGAVIAIFPKSIMITFSLCIGAFVIFGGIQRLILGVAINKIDHNGSLFFVSEAIVTILLGIIILTQRFINLLGFFLIIYSISELMGYIYYTTQNKDYSSVLNKKVTKEMKESKSKDAIIEED